MLRFPDKPAGSVSELQSAVAQLVDQFGAVAEARLILNQDIGTASTAIAHGVRGVPRAVFVMGQADARIWRSAAPDTLLIYLQASAAVTADVMVIP